MELKLTAMNKSQLVDYISKWKKKQKRFEDGSHSWQKCYRRIKRAERFLNVVEQLKDSFE